MKIGMVLVLTGALLVLAGRPIRTKGATPQHASVPTAAEVFQTARQSVVLILAAGDDGKELVQGSGFIVARDRVATNHHVVQDTSKAVALFSDGSTVKISAVAADSRANDLTIVVLPTGDRPPLRLGDESTLRVGDTVYAIGSPEGLELTFTEGIVSGFRNENEQFRIQDTAPIAHGSSGGPLLDRQGRVVGVTTAMLAGAPGIYFSVGVDDLKHLLRAPSPVLIPFAQWGLDSEFGPVPVTKQGTSHKEGNGQSETGDVERLIDQKRYGDARAKLKGLLSASPKDPTLLTLMGEIDTIAGKTSDALSELSIAVSESPSDARARDLYAVNLFASGRYRDALSQEKAAQSTHPTPHGNGLIALSDYALGEYTDADAAARSSLAGDPSNELALQVIAGLAFHRLCGEGPSWQGAVNQLSKITPDSFWVKISEALSAYKANQLDAFVSDLQTAKQDYFPDPEAFLLLSSAYVESSQIGDANSQIAAGLIRFPDASTLLSQGVFVSLLSRDRTGARRDMDLLTSTEPQAFETLETECLYYYGTDQANLGLAYCAQATQLEPESHTAHSNYGWTALDANQFRLARQEFSRAYELAKPGLARLSSNDVIDLVWGFAIASYYTGHKKDARKLVRFLSKSYPLALSVANLQQLPLLWSQTTLNRIQLITLSLLR